MNSLGHLTISLIKSMFRMFGCIAALFTGSVFILALFFIVAELLGIVEELVDKR